MREAALNFIVIYLSHAWSSMKNRDLPRDSFGTICLLNTAVCKLKRSGY